VNISLQSGSTRDRHQIRRSGGAAIWLQCRRLDLRCPCLVSGDDIRKLTRIICSNSLLITSCRWPYNAARPVCSEICVCRAFQHDCEDTSINRETWINFWIQSQERLDVYEHLRLDASIVALDNRAVRRSSECFEFPPKLLVTKATATKVPHVEISSWKLLVWLHVLLLVHYLIIKWLWCCFVV
jgi:hypothetical protein